MQMLKSETKAYIMHALNEKVEQARERLYAELRAGGSGVAAARELGCALRAREDFDEFVETDEEAEK